MFTGEPVPSQTLTVKVFTRHSKQCSKHDDPLWRKCDCRKSLYIYDRGAVRYQSARTRSWAKAESRAREEMDARDPVKQALRAIEEEKKRIKEAEEARLAAEEARRAEALAQRITVEAALDEWLAGLPKKSRSRTVQFRALASKLKSWAREHGIVHLVEIKSPQLYAWRGSWSSKARNKRDRLGSSTQNLYVSHLHRFFKWALQAEYIERDPSLIVKREKFDHVQTQPLRNAEQFEEILEATRKLDAEPSSVRKEGQYGRDLRAIFLLQRWTGIRLVDALLMKRTNIRHGMMTIVTKKNRKLIKNRPLPQQVLEALDAIPKQPHVRDGCYFWSRRCHEDNLTPVWAERIKELNRYLKLTNDENKPMEFRSHMLRDTFAVELLLLGVALEKVSFLLTHDSVRMTEKYYAPWVEKRRKQVHVELVAALGKMGANFPAPEFA
jgi:integrase/recombinase XerD